jgi:hypothetical protein
MWIERERGSTTRKVFVFESGNAGQEDGKMEAANNNQQEESMDLTGDGEEKADETVSIHPNWKSTHTAVIDGRVVYKVESYDLRGKYFPQLLGLETCDIDGSSKQTT